MHDKEYLVHAGGISYSEAVAYCKTKGGKLVEPKSVQNNNDLVTLAKGIEIQGSGVWIGINDISKEGQFTYASDGKSLSFTNWNSGQPESGKSGQSGPSVDVVTRRRRSLPNSDDVKETGDSGVIGVSGDSGDSGDTGNSGDSGDSGDSGEDSGVDQDCGILNLQGKWNDASCTKENSFICERYQGNTYFTTYT